MSPGDAYYMVLYSSQDAGTNPTTSHCFATFARISGSAAPVELHHITWFSVRGHQTGSTCIAYFPDDMRRQVSEATGIAPERTGTPPFLRRLRAIARTLPRDQRRLSVALFAVVSETLISGILAQVPRDERVVTAVRALIADHAEDEGRHSAFFSQFFAYLSPRLGSELQATLGPLLPQFILAFLEPDASAVRRDLA
jgi:hypothetical protein